MRGRATGGAGRRLPGPTPGGGGYSYLPFPLPRPLSKRARTTRPPSSRRTPTESAPSNLCVPGFEPCSDERLNPSRRRASHRNDRVPLAKPAEKKPRTTQTPSHSAAAPRSPSARPGRAAGPIGTGHGGRGWRRGRPRARGRPPGTRLGFSAFLV